MIHSHDRSLWVGASDIEELIALYNSDKANTHSNFIAVKTGLIDNPNIKSLYMKAGDLYERQIVDYSEVESIENHRSKNEEIRRRSPFRQAKSALEKVLPTGTDTDVCMA